MSQRASRFMAAKSLIALTAVLLNGATARAESVDKSAAHAAAGLIHDVPTGLDTKNSMSRETEDDDLLPEYDFTGGIRGKYYEQYQKRAWDLVESGTASWSGGKPEGSHQKPRPDIVLEDRR
jgi:hypothetical protein